MRDWSREMMIRMLQKMGIKFMKKYLPFLTEAQWNELGDWAWYRANSEPDYIRNRPVPTAIRVICEEHEATRVIDFYSVAPSEAGAMPSSEPKRRKKAAGK